MRPVANKYKFITVANMDAKTVGGFVLGILVGLFVNYLFSYSSGGPVPVPPASDAGEGVRFVQWQEQGGGEWLAKTENGNVYRCWEKNSNNQYGQMLWGTCWRVATNANTDTGVEVRCIPKDSFPSIGSDGFCRLTRAMVGVPKVPSQ